MISSAYTNMIPEKDSLRLKAFMTKNDQAGISVELKGKIDSFSTNDRIEKDDIVRSSQDKSRVTVRLYDKEGLKKGDILFVINEKNLIISKVTVDLIYKSKSFGLMMIGFGNFRFASLGDRVVQTIEDSNSRYAYKFKARGDYFFNKGDKSAAIVEYKKSLEHDRNYPEAHFELGNIYYEDELYHLAIDEYQKAYENRHRISDREDRFLLLKNMVEARIVIVEGSTAIDKMDQSKRKEIAKRYRSESLKLCGEAIELNPESSEIYFFLGKLKYEKSDAPRDSDADAKNYFLKALKFNPNNSEASVYLAILYKRNGNTRKAKYYIEKAIEADPSNQRARDISKKID